jgi:hypothetical protein
MWENTAEITACPYGSIACLGGKMTGGESCADGYTGPLCAVCDDGYYFQSSGESQCVICPTSGFSPGSIALLVLAGLGLLAALVVFAADGLFVLK